MAKQNIYDNEVQDVKKPLCCLAKWFFDALRCKNAKAFLQRSHHFPVRFAHGRKMIKERVILTLPRTGKAGSAD